jgi:hypothetical protein
MNSAAASCMFAFSVASHAEQLWTFLLFAADSNT